MNPEELLLYLARDPEQARAAIEQQKKMAADESRQRVRRQAWTSLRGLLLRTQSLARVVEEVQRAQIHRDRGAARLPRAVPPETWPWFFLVDLAQAARNAVRPRLGAAAGGAFFRAGLWV